MFSVVKPAPGTATKQTTKVEHTEGIFSNTLGDIDFFDRDVVRQHKEYSKKYEMERKCNCRNDQDMNKRKTSNDLSSPVSNKSKEVKTSSVTKSNVSNLSHCKSNSSLKENDISFGYHFHEKHYCGKTNEKMYCPKHEKGHRLYYSIENLKKTNGKLEEDSCPKKNQIMRMCQQEANKQESKAILKVNMLSNSSEASSSFDSGIDSSNNFNNVPCIKTILKIPKPRNPFAKKNYSISTLNPPFSCFKGGAGEGGYPSYQGLASVYQHSFKPVEARKRALLQTVFQ